MKKVFIEKKTLVKYKNNHFREKNNEK